jgi:hypothetical protein
VADMTAQTATIDMNVKTKRFILIISGGYNSFAAVALIPGSLCR